MRVLAVRQPWAEEIITGRKTIEVRSQNTLARERVAIYATRTTPTKQDLEWLEYLGHPINNIVEGFIIGTVEIHNSMHVRDADHFHKNLNNHLCYQDMYKKGQHFWHLQNEQRINAIPFKMPRGAVIWSFIDNKLIYEASLK